MARLLPLISVLLLLSIRADELIWQPVIDYSISFAGDRPDAAPSINSFENFTHFASDFGWMGPGEGRIDSRGGVISIRPDGEWTGAWHSLAGLARESNRQLNPSDVIGLGPATENLAKIRKIAINASGEGVVRIELVNAAREVVWKSSVEIHDERTVSRTLALDPETLGPIKFMDWIAEPGSHLKISSMGFLVERPKLSIEEWAFRVSLGKLRRCHDEVSGLTRDRGHLPAGKFDSVPATGMHALASALGVREGLLDRAQVVAEVRRTAEVFRELPKASGFLPHFTHRGDDGRPTIHPGTEFSTVDTSLALHSLLLAARILELADLEADVVSMITRLDFDALTDAEGWISHGFHDDGKTLLTSQWKDWGGETALVLALEAMVPNRQVRGRMNGGGQVYRGVAFIAEIQSLFYPDFDRPEVDRISNVVWPDARRSLMERQMQYIPSTWPGSAAAKAGIFGLSAGEAGMPGAGYTANGVEVVGVRWIHPHAMMMQLALIGGGDAYRQGLERLERAGFLYPRGLPENAEVELRLHNPMQGSLNAAFEVLAAYHGWRRGSGKDLLDEAARQSPEMRLGAARFYAP